MKNQRREVYTRVVYNLSDIQASYRKIIRYLDKRAADPYIDESLRLELEKQIDIAIKNIERLESIKYFSSLALLTEGVLVTDEEISEIVISLEELMNICDFERDQSDEITVQNWAEEKKNIYDTLRQSLLAIFSYKLDHKKKLGGITVQ
jgi:hypothetical protein